MAPNTFFFLKRPMHRRRAYHIQMPWMTSIGSMAKMGKIDHFAT